MSENNYLNVNFLIILYKIITLEIKLLFYINIPCYNLYKMNYLCNKIKFDYFRIKIP